MVLPTHELADPRYAANPPDRCYICKGHILDTLLAHVQAEGYPILADGSNADDRNDYRPGSHAGAERGVRSPLQEAGLTKAEVRALAASMDCPTGIARGRMPGVAHPLRHAGHIRGIEADRARRRAPAPTRLSPGPRAPPRCGGPAGIGAERSGRAVELRDAIVSALRDVGFTYVALDLAGFRSGSMNQELKP